MRPLTILFLALLPVAAHANLRAPVRVDRAASSALHPAEGLVVLGEALQFVCEGERCGVTASYRVRAALEGDYALRFVLPVDQAVEAAVGPGLDPVRVRVSPSRPMSDAELDSARGANRHVHEFRAHEPQLYEAAFDAHLVPGETSIVVRYPQPLGSLERDYGYFKKHGRFVKTFRYEVWPLKEWTLDGKFRLDVAVSVMRASAPGWWTRHFGHYQSAGCYRWGGGESVAAAIREEPQSLEWSLHLDRAQVPDVLECQIGDDDLVPR